MFHHNSVAPSFYSNRLRVKGILSVVSIINIYNNTLINGNQQFVLFLFISTPRFSSLKALLAAGVLPPVPCGGRGGRGGKKEGGRREEEEEGGRRKRVSSDGRVTTGSYLTTSRGELT